MGCKESKHKVAEGNTIITPSPSSRHSNVNIVGNNKKKDVQAIPENPTTRAKSPVQKQESLKANGGSNADAGTSDVNIKNAKGDSEVDGKVKEGEIVEVFDDKEIKKENVGESNGKIEGVVDDKEKANLVSDEYSLDKFYSSRKDDETIDGIISEGVSGTSVYYTPHKKGASKESKNTEEKKAETKDEIKTELAVANVTEGDSMKQVEAAGLVEGNPSKEAEATTTLAKGNSVETADVVEVNSVKVAKENPLKQVEVIEDLGKEIKTADINEEHTAEAANATEEKLVKEEKVVNVAEEKPVKEVETSGVTEGNPVIKVEAVEVDEENKVKEAEAIDASKANPVKQEAEQIVESKGAANKENKIPKC